MKLAEQHIIHDDRFREGCINAKNLYNQVLYYCRQSIFGKIQFFKEYEISSLFCEFDEDNFRSLPSGTSQQIIKSVFKSVISWRLAVKEYAKNPSKFLGRPRLPKYKKEMSELYFTKIQIFPKEGFLNFPKKMNIPPIRTKIKKDSFKQCRVIPKSNHFVVEIIYEVQESPIKEYKKNGNWIGIDIGLNNMATISSNRTRPVIINGKPIKSVNNFYNKRKRKLQSKLAINTYTSKRIERIIFSRNQKIKDYTHKASRNIVNFALENDITKIIIGKNENWKKSINLGKKTNREFTSIPHASFIEKIQYKARLAGIEVILTQEAYTSKCSALDMEPICKHENYVGKRKKRGLFVTATGRLINADVNGSINIARLVLGDEIINSDSIRSCGAQPYKIKTFA